MLQAAVLAELVWEPSIIAGHIGVTADDGVATLSGHVNSYVQKQAAESAARRVKGVKAVVEEIDVRLPFDVKHDDDDIARAAVDRLSWDASVPRDAVKVNVAKGWLKLTGEVEWHFQKDAAEQDVRGLTGVVSLSNQISIKPRANAARIDEGIMHALHRSRSTTGLIMTSPKALPGQRRAFLTSTTTLWSIEAAIGDPAGEAPPLSVSAARISATPGREIDSK